MGQPARTTPHPPTADSLHGSYCVGRVIRGCAIIVLEIFVFVVTMAIVLAALFCDMADRTTSFEHPGRKEMSSE